MLEVGDVDLNGRVSCWDSGARYLVRGMVADERSMYLCHGGTQQLLLFEKLGWNSPGWEVEDKRKCYGRASRRILGLEWHLLLTTSPWRSIIGELIASRLSNVLSVHTPPSILLAKDG